MSTFNSIEATDRKAILKAIKEQTEDGYMTTSTDIIRQAADWLTPTLFGVSSGTRQAVRTGTEARLKDVLKRMKREAKDRYEQALSDGAPMAPKWKWFPYSDGTKQVWPLCHLSDDGTESFDLGDALRKKGAETIARGNSATASGVARSRRTTPLFV